MGQKVTVTYDGFVATFPEFADVGVYPQVTVTAYLEKAQCYISARNSKRLKNGCREYAIYLMTAHILTLRDAMNGDSQGGQVGFNTRARIDKVDVTIEAPESNGAFQEWISLSGYGRELRALLANRAAVPALISTATPYRVFQ